MNRVIALSGRRISALLLFAAVSFLGPSEIKAQSNEYIAIDLSEKLSQAWGYFGVYISALAGDSNGNIYVLGVAGGDTTHFGKYNLSTGTFDDLSAKLTTLGDRQHLFALAADATHNIVYLGGYFNTVIFAAYDIPTGTLVDLSDRVSILEGFLEIDVLTVDPVNGVVYLGGFGGAFGGTFARYNPASYVGGGSYPSSDTAYELTALSWVFPYSGVTAFAFDETHRVVYIGGDSNYAFARYNTADYAGGGPYPDPDTAYSLFGGDVYAIYDFAFDPDNGGVLYVAGWNPGAEWIRYNTTTFTGNGPYPGADMGNRLTPKFEDLGLSLYADPFTLVFEPLNRDVYLGNAGGELAGYKISTDTMTDFTPKIAPFLGSVSITSLIFEPRTAAVYIGGDGGRFGKIAVPNNTPVGTDIVIQPTNATTDAAPAVLTFSTVTQTGTTGLATGSPGTDPPPNFRLGNPPTYYDLTTDAVFSGPVTVCINYTGVDFKNESRLKLFHFENGTWVNKTVSLDTAENVVCASVDSL